MSAQHAGLFSRRKFLSGMTLVGTAGLLGLHSRPGTAEPPPETTRLRLVRRSPICVAPEYMAEELLQGEGFSEVRYVRKETLSEVAKALTAGEVDLTRCSAHRFSCKALVGFQGLRLNGHLERANY